MNNKPTDSEIVKDCKNCIRYTTCIFCIIGGRSISKDCNDFVELDTINSLQAENERLKGWQDLLKAEKHSLIKAEAYKEFAEWIIREYPETKYFVSNLLKEMVGDNNGQ